MDRRRQATPFGRPLRADKARLKSSDLEGLIRVGHLGCESEDKASAGPRTRWIVNSRDKYATSMFHEIPEPPAKNQPSHLGNFDASEGRSAIVIAGDRDYLVYYADDPSNFGAPTGKKGQSKFRTGPR